MSVDVEGIKLLQQMPIFGGVSAETIRSLHEQAEVVSIRQGDLFFDQGAVADGVYVLERGQAVVMKSCQGHTYRLNSLQVGDCFGEMSIIDLARRSAAVEAIEDCRAIRLSIAGLHDVYKTRPDQYILILMNMAREISRRLRIADERLFIPRMEQDDVPLGWAHYLV